MLPVLTGTPPPPKAGWVPQLDMTHSGPAWPQTEPADLLLAYSRAFLGSAGLLPCLYSSRGTMGQGWSG